VWNVSDGKCLQTLTGHSGEVNTVAWSKTGLLASGSEDCTVKIWNSSTGECLNTLEGHSEYVSCVHFNPTNPSQLVSGSGDKTIRLWDVDSEMKSRT
jgi:WD40 repeat protein